MITFLRIVINLREIYYNFLYSIKTKIIYTLLICLIFEIT